MDPKLQGSRLLRLALVGVLFALAALTVASPAHATEDYLSLWRSLYPDSVSADHLESACTLCHAGSHSEFNGYGWDFKQHGFSFSAIESLNSDGDPSGAGNLEEINADTQPGWTDGAHNVINGGAVSSSEIPAEIIAGTFDPGDPVEPGDSGVGTVTIAKNGDWGSGFQGRVVITNDTSDTIGWWSVTFEADFTIDQIWHGQIVSHTGNTYVVEGYDWNKSIAPGDQLRFGFNASPGNRQLPTQFKLIDLRRPDNAGDAPPDDDVGDDFPNDDADDNPAQDNDGDVSTQVTMENINDWGAAFQGSVVIVNTGAAAINEWRLGFDAGFEINQIWNAEIVSHSGTAYVLKGMDYNRTIEPSGQVSFGFVASPGGSAMPASFTVNGDDSNPGNDDPGNDDPGNDDPGDDDPGNDDPGDDDPGNDDPGDDDPGNDDPGDDDPGNDDPGDDDPGNDDPGDDNPGNDDPGNDDPGDEINQCSDTTYGPRMLKLLTRIEYQNSIEDLVGIDFDVSDSIPFDALIEGYFNNAFAPVTESHVDAYMIVAEKVAAWSAQRNFADVVDCGFDSSGNASVSYQECEDRFLNDFATRVFRRPLTSEELSIYQTVFEDSQSSGDIKAGLELGMTALLTAPQFLYRSETGTAVEDLPADSIDPGSLDSGSYVLSDYEMAGFVSYTITGSTPDQELLTAAKNGRLSTKAQIRQQITRLLATDRARQHMGVFAAQWLGTDEILTIQKDTTLFPDFTDEVRDAMAAEVKAFFTHVFYDAEQGFGDLFSADYVFVNRPLANYYGLGDVGADSSDPDDMVMVDAAGANRGGLLTMGAFMAIHSDLTESSPIKRAHNIRARLLCQDLPQPDATIAMFRAEEAEKLLQELAGKVITNREFIATITEEEPCASCHRTMINPLGFGFEDYDASGRYRSQDANGLSIDSSGTLIGVHTLNDGDSIDFYGTKDGSNMFAGLESAQSCFSANVFRYAMDIGHDAINAASQQAGDLTDEEKADYQCSVETLTTILETSDSMADLFTRLGTLDLVRFRKQRDR